MVCGGPQALPIYNNLVLSVDIGGGSTELVLGLDGQPLYTASMRLGHLRLQVCRRLQKLFGACLLAPSPRTACKGPLSFTTSASELCLFAALHRTGVSQTCWHTATSRSRRWGRGPCIRPWCSI